MSISCRFVAPLSISASLTIALIAAPVYAAKGFSLTGYGARSAGLSGADIAVVNDSTALAINPAGLVQVPGPTIDAYIEPFSAVGSSHKDQFSGRDADDGGVVPFLGAGYAAPLEGGNFAYGVGVYAQGGLGNRYDDFQTPFGTRDDMNAIFGVVSMIPGVAWRVDERFRLGAAIGLSYGTARQKLFPNTSVFDPQAPTDPQKTFFGSRFDGGKAFGSNLRLGLQYEILPSLTLAMTYQTKTKLDLKNANVTVNYDAIGLGKVRYASARQEGLAFAAELGAGLSYRVAADWLVAFEYNWMDQQHAVNDLRLTARSPDDPNAPPEVEVVQPLNFRNVNLWSIGVEHSINERTVAQVGYTYASNALPSDTLSPIIALIAETTVGAGIQRRVSDRYAVGTSLEYQIPKTRRYNNDGLPFGPAQERSSALLWTVMVSYR